jgi:hypothetical protein
MNTNCGEVSRLLKLDAYVFAREMSNELELVVCYSCLFLFSPIWEADLWQSLILLMLRRQ